MNTTKYLLLAGAALALAACSADDESVAALDAPVAAIIAGSIDDGRSRAADESWDAGDMIGISTTSAGNTRYANMKYQTSSISGDFGYVGDKGAGIFFQDSETVTFSAYYPFTGDDGISPGTLLDISTADQTAQSSFDYLFARSEAASFANPAVKLSFSHKMARLVLNISAASDINLAFGDIQNGTFYLNGIQHGGTFNTENGTAAAADNADADYDWLINALPEDEGSVRAYTLILFPQTISKLTFKAVINGKEYAGDFNNLSLAAGTSRAFDITIMETDLVIGTQNITDRVDGGSGSGSATLDPFNGREAVLMRKASPGQPELYIATRNIGAEKPADPGLYFWWGDIKGHAAGSGFNFSKTEREIATAGKSYAELKSAGFIGADNNLPPGKDAARKHWGGRWRIPTLEDIKWLLHPSNCDWEWQDNPAGYIVTSITTDGKIFLPAAGRYDGTSRLAFGEGGFYWISSFTTENAVPIGCLSFLPVYGAYNCEPWFGLSVRPVSN